MAWSVGGVRGQSWHGADWVVRNAFAFLVPALRRAGAPTLAERCEEALASGAHVLDLGAELDEEAASERWRRAVEAALAAVDAEAGAEWNDARHFGAFRTAVARLSELARSDGNRHVLSLLETSTP